MRQLTTILAAIIILSCASSNTKSCECKYKDGDVVRGVDYLVQRLDHNRPIKIQTAYRNVSYNGVYPTCMYVCSQDSSNLVGFELETLNEDAIESNWE